MVPVNELRIGNWVECNGIKFRITGTHLSAMQVDPSTKEIFPILLTAELLEQCGFWKDNRSSRFYKSPYFIYAPGSPISSYAFGIIGRGVITTMKYIHQFQNIYFWLSTCEELKIEFNEKIQSMGSR